MVKSEGGKTGATYTGNQSKKISQEGGVGMWEQRGGERPTSYIRKVMTGEHQDREGSLVAKPACTLTAVQRNRFKRMQYSGSL